MAHKSVQSKILNIQQANIKSGGDGAFFVYLRKNTRGKLSEFWHHVAGCRQWFKVLRSTATHEIFKTAKINEEL